MMLSALRNEEWLMHSYPFSTLGDMESEIAELRTLTRVTKLRQQIECRQEGAWMMVRDVPDEKSKSGTRKVTSYGRTSRSVTRSFSQNVSGNQAIFDSGSPANVIIEHPSDDETKESEDNNTKSVEITEIIDEPPEVKSEEKVPEQTQIPIKKTSVVTLGKGNLVLIDDEDSNFQVTGISKGRVADAVSTLERVTQAEKKVKKVGFCKTEVHFAPDSGRVKIVETDEKPPPTQMLRKKKRSRTKNVKPDFPKLYFGDTTMDIAKHEPHFNNSQRSTFTVIREPSPLLTLSATQGKKREEKNDDYGYVKKVSLPNIETKFSGEMQNLGYLGNVSPKLCKLLQNSLQHEFQVKQKQIMKNREHSEERPQMNLKVACETELNKPLKIVTQVSLGTEGGEVEHKVVLKSGNTNSEPIYINRDVIDEIRKETSPSRPTEVKEKAPKPKPRTTITVTSQASKDLKTSLKLVKQPEKIKRSTPKLNEVCSKKENTQIRSTSKQCTRKVSNRNEKKTVKCEVNNTGAKLHKLIKDGSIQEKPAPEARVRKSREPLRSFEKVSNGWVGHCITPIKTTVEVNPKTQVTVTTKVQSNKPSNTSYSTNSQGSRRSNTTSSGVTKTVTRARNEDKSAATSKVTLTENNKQFSLSKEHLRSAKLVKELTNKNNQTITRVVETSSQGKKHISSTALHNSRIVETTNRSTPRVGIVRPRIIQHSDQAKNNTVTIRNTGIRRTTEQQQTTVLRQRRDSDQSDDSVVRADEEVRAYMFNTRHK